MCVEREQEREKKERHKELRQKYEGIMSFVDIHLFSPATYSSFSLKKKKKIFRLIGFSKFPKDMTVCKKPQPTLGFKTQVCKLVVGKKATIAIF